MKDIINRLPFPDQVRWVTMAHTEAQGPCLARERIEKELLEDEDFVLMIDAHTLFCPSWDILMEEEWGGCGNPKAILTAYPREYFPNRGWKDSNGTFLRAHRWQGSGQIPTFIAQTFEEAPPTPLPSITWIAGFSFMPASAPREVPYLSDVPYLFIGEEVGMAVLYFTHGYRFFAPSKSLVQTTYKHSGKHKFEELSWLRIIRTQSQLKIRSLIGALKGDRKGLQAKLLGSHSSLEDYYAYSGINLPRSKFSSHALLGITGRDSPQDETYKWGSGDGGRAKRSALLRRKLFDS